MACFLTAFAVIFVLVLAFSSSTKRTTVWKVDPATGEKVSEIHETAGPTPGQTAARAVLWIIGIIISLFIIIAIIGAASNAH
jgi:hypothetical protein